MRKRAIHSLFCAILPISHDSLEPNRWIRARLRARTGAFIIPGGHGVAGDSAPAVSLRRRRFLSALYPCLGKSYERSARLFHLSRVVGLWALLHFVDSGCCLSSAGPR
jgi:hypothetical protein